MTIEKRLQGKRALVTGAGTGIGREVALEFARQGASVMLHYASSASGAESAADEARQLGVTAAVCQADLGQVTECLCLVDDAIVALGGLDILVNNSGVTLTRGFLDTSADEFDEIYNVNIRGQFFCAQRAVRHMLGNGGGSIVNMTSVHGLVAMPGHSVYAGTKGAICAWTRELAIELAPRVRVNAIAPGWVDVPRQHKPGYNLDVAKTTVPMQRAGIPLDIAKGCVYLASEESSFVTGQVLVIDGGTTSWMSLAAARRAD